MESFLHLHQSSFKNNKQLPLLFIPSLIFIIILFIFYITKVTLNQAKLAANEGKTVILGSELENP